MNNTVWEKGEYRIVEHQDIDFDMANLEGDMFNPECHPDIPEAQILKERDEFYELVNDVGVFGYELEKWNAAAGKGWEHVDSCWGFVGSYSETEEKFKHYIVQEMIDQAGVEP